VVNPGRWWLRHGLGPLLVRWWRRRGLRARVTLTAAVGLLVAFAAADLLLFSALRVSLTRSVDDSARSGAVEVQALINADRLPNPAPVPADITIQVIDSSGYVTNVSSGADRLVPIVSLGQARALADGGGAMTVHGAPFDMPALLRVVVVPADGGQLVIAAAPFGEASGSLNVVARALVIFTPVLFIAFTGAIWLVTGSTLRPIGALRRGAARVTATGLPSDLPVPEARDEVRLLALTLNDMLSQLSAAQQRQRALVSDTAHELRSPIASIRAQLEVALDFPASQDWETTARDVHADVLRLARLAEDLLLLARLDEQAGLAVANGTAGLNGGRTSPADPARRGLPVDLESLSRSVVCRYADARVPVTVTAAGAPPRDAAAPYAAAPDAAVADAADTRPATRAVVTDLWNARAGTATATRNATGTAPDTEHVTSTAIETDGTVVVIGDQVRLERLLVNLVDNAVRYAKSSVTVAVCRDGGWAELSVTDDGPGIPSPDRERVFNRFARLDDARSRDEDEPGGAGLGLAIVRATAQAYGGTAHLESAHLESALPTNAPPRDLAGFAAGLRAVVRLPAAEGLAIN
jgi:signal transduction histidine kinase